MKNRYSRIVLNTLEGQDFEITYGQNEEIIVNIKGNETNLHSKKRLKILTLITLKLHQFQADIFILKENGIMDW